MFNSVLRIRLVMPRSFVVINRFEVSCVVACLFNGLVDKKKEKKFEF